jgi:hypothetical protein
MTECNQESFSSSAAKSHAGAWAIPRCSRTPISVFPVDMPVSSASLRLLTLLRSPDSRIAFHLLSTCGAYDKFVIRR